MSDMRPEGGQLNPDYNPAMIGGIPARLFHVTGVGRVLAEHGDLFYDCWYHSASFSFGAPTHDPEVYDYPHFMATRQPYKDGSQLGLSVRNRVSNPAIIQELGLDPRDPRHPGIYPARLLTAALTHFAASDNSETPIKYLRGVWFPNDSVNFDQYHATLRASSALQAGERQRVAAFSTWTGRQAIRHGFSDVTVLEGRDWVRARFARPDTYGGHN